MHSSMTPSVSFARLAAGRCVSATAALFFLRLLRTSIQPHSADTIRTAALPPYISVNPTRKAIVKAPKPVTNHPDTTVSTPVMR